MPALKPEDVKRLDANFSYHPPHGEQESHCGMVRDGGKHFSWTLMEYCPPSRELSLALTKVEEAVFWANAAIARNEKPA